MTGDGIAEGLSRNSSLQELNLSHNLIGLVALEVLSEKAWRRRRRRRGGAKGKQAMDFC